MTAPFSPRKRIYLELADKQLKSLGLEQDFPGRRKDPGALIDSRSVDPDRDPVALANAVDTRPFADRALNVVSASRVQQFLEIGVVIRPPELAIRKIQRLAPALPSWSVIGPSVVSLVILTGITSPLSSLPRITIKSPTHP